MLFKENETRQMGRRTGQRGDDLQIIILYFLNGAFLEYRRMK